MKRTTQRAALPRWQVVVLGIAMVAAVTEVRAQAQEGIDTVIVTGSRIKTIDAQGQSPVFTLSHDDLVNSGRTSVGEILQELTTSGKALNTKFNSSGNFGYPPDAGGIGAGSAQADLRHLTSKRVLVLVDGLRWVNESSASGVSTVVDLNTIPMSIIERIEVLEDGASAIYGSDAISGVINIITRRDFDGAEALVYFGGYDEGDGETTRGELSVGGKGDRSSFFLSVSYTDQELVAASDRDRSLFPVPGTGVTRGSSATPQGRLIFTDPNTGQTPDITLNTGTDTPVYDPANPTGGVGTYHGFTTADRFNFAPFNLVLTPNERKGLYTQFRYDLTNSVEWYIKGLYNTRTSVNRAAPEPIFLGSDAGTGGLADTVSISALNPFNPFGFDLISGQNFFFGTRRPLEGGPRIYEQDVDTYYFATGFEGSFGAADRQFFWDVNLVDSENRADQTANNNYNVRHIQQALGDPAECAAIPGCVPLNYFGGQGANGEGTITQAMLDWIQYVGHDSSETSLNLASANVSGELFPVPAGALSFAAGYEHREYEGSFQPDSLKISGESNDVLAQPTAGQYDLDEFYLEFNVPILKDVPLVNRLDVSVAGRYSDYSTFGGEEIFKYGVRWQPFEDLIIRGTVAEGLRAPAIGELFGSQSRFDATISDPCSEYPNSPNPTIQTNCAALNIPAAYEQLNPQISILTGGNPNLLPETSDSWTAGLVYSPAWAEDLSWSSRVDLEFTYYNHEIEGGIQAVDAQTQLDQCALTLSASFCSGITRTPTGSISSFTNTLTNITTTETDGFDVKLSWASPETSVGQFVVSWNNTIVSDYKEIGPTGEEQPRQEGIEVNDGAIPEWQSTLGVDWTRGPVRAGLTARYIDEVVESCSDAQDNSPNSLTNLGLCSDPNLADNGLSTNKLDATTYLDVQFGWEGPFNVEGLDFTIGVNNVTDEDPPICLSCSLNGYDAGTYDIPGMFWYAQAGYKF